MDKPIVGIFREKRDNYFEFKAPHYRQAYIEIGLKLEQKGIYPAILVGQSTYLGQGKFSKHWHPVKDGDNFDFEERGEITVDMVWNKDHFIDDGKVLTVNTRELNEICWSKNKTYEVLSEFHPKTLNVQSAQELRDAIDSVPSEMVAVKEIEGSSGDGVFVGLKRDAYNTNLKFPLIVQEFIETSAGVPGITDKRHDVRVVLANGQPIAATLRTPPEGGFKSNLGYGGENRLLNISDLPDDLLQICSNIDKVLQRYGKFRLYSVDFGLTPNGWRMFEANGMPGVIAVSRGEQAIEYQDKLTDFLKMIGERVKGKK
ncbi:MAG TPA: hypothetical protein VLA77_01810 [Candidatus Saccharimonadales bacterium]|nr:hypothetical protein [Candidatus Saccharimonadales bacterium]